MLDDPRVNFAISIGSGEAGISHLGIQAEDEHELADVYERLSRAERPIVEEKEPPAAMRDPTSNGSPIRKACRGRHSLRTARRPSTVKAAR